MGTAISNLFGSVMMRLALIYGALAMMTGAAILVGWLVFQSIAANMLTLSEERLPELRNSARVVAVVDRIRAALTDKLVAETEEDLARLGGRAKFIINDIHQSVKNFEPAKAQQLLEKVDKVEAAFMQLIAARTDNLRSSENVATAVQNVMMQSTAAATILAEQTDNAYFNLVLGSDDTIASIGDTLARLIEEDFTLYQIVLEVRSEINLLSGLALGISQSRDAAMLAILQDLVSASHDRLEKLLPVLRDGPGLAEVAVLVEEANATFSRSATNAANRVRPAEILALRQSVDATLSSTLDDIYFELVIKSDDAKTANETSIRALMDGEVNRIRTQAALDSATKSFFAAVMQTALSRDPTELATRGNELAQAAMRLEDAMSEGSPEVVATLEPILDIADSNGGIVTLRQASFEAGEVARRATETATAAVQEIAREINSFAASAQDHIDGTAQMLNTKVVQAGEQMKTIAIASLVLVLLAPVLIWKMISSPLRHVTQVTERLAEGDLSEITGLDRKKGEIGRMAEALKVFRAGALERIRLQEEEQKRQSDALEAERAAERAKREADIKEREDIAAREAEERAREAREQERLEQARRATEAERKARGEEQEAVVSELAASLRHLSEGNFSHRLNTEFPGSYEALRHDYNAAIDKLAELIRKLGKSAGHIDASSAGIAASSLDLSRRTENSAATLEETAAALSELTASVASAATGASTASDTVVSVKNDAENSQKVMHDAVTAMSEIEQSSAKITKIVEVIDSISFQTNLLALNAGVEAARAGDAGRGFAVVASEVRILAHRCSEAALQINGLVSESASHVENGVSLIDQTNDALANILAGITDVARNVADIAMSANEQSSGIAEINTAVEQLDRTTQQNAAMFEETNSASQTLTEEASKLARIVAGFVVSDTSAAPQSGWHDEDGEPDQSSSEGGVANIEETG